MPKLFRKPLTVGHTLAVIAAVVVLGGGAFAVASIPGPSGVIKSCVEKAGSAKGAVRVIDSANTCRSGERTMRWNQKGRRGAAGATKVTVRSKNLVLTYFCTSAGAGLYTCIANVVTATAHCHTGERATGGGYGKPNDETAPDVTESTPAPSTGTPTAWTVTASSSAGSGVASHPDTVVPVRVVCAAP
jgi:hypothetical protein